MKINYIAAIFFGAAFLAGMVAAAFTLLPSLRMIEDGLTCLAGECSDLAAQRSMAIAAWAMVGLSILATLVGGASLALIFWTLDAARRSAKSAEDAVVVAREMGNRQTRAYVTVSSAAVMIDDALHVSLELKNSGSTPAFDVDLKFRIQIAFVAADGKPAPVNFRPADFRLPDIAAQDREPCQQTITVGPTQRLSAALRGREFAVKVGGTITYRDVFGNVTEAPFGFGGRPSHNNEPLRWKLSRLPQPE